MYKFKREKQISFTDFNQPLGLQMNPDNRWVKKAEMIPWETIEAEYAKLFPSYTGMPAKPLRMALGSLLIQKQYHYPDEELVEQIRENPYYQYFIGLPGYEDKIPFVPSLLVEFRKRLSEDVLNEINEMIIEYNAQKSDDDSDDDDHDGNAKSDTSDHQDETNESENAGTLILDATCAPQNIKYPQDIELLNEAREKLEDMICRISEEYGFYRPRMYRQKARKDYLALAKCRKRGAKKSEKQSKSSCNMFAAILDISRICLKTTALSFQNPTHICSTFWKRFIRSSSICLTTTRIPLKTELSASASRISVRSSEARRNLQSSSEQSWICQWTKTECAELKSFLSMPTMSRRFENSNRKLQGTHGSLSGACSCRSDLSQS